MKHTRSDKLEAFWFHTYTVIQHLLVDVSFEAFVQNPWRYTAELSRINSKDHIQRFDPIPLDLSSETKNRILNFPYELDDFIRYADAVYMDMLRHYPRCERNRYRVH